MLRFFSIVLAFATAVSMVAAQSLPIGGQGKPFVKVNAPVVALTHVRVIDGTGAPARADQTVVIKDGAIAAVGPSASTPAPEGATVIDGSGKSVMPGIVMV